MARTIPRAVADILGGDYDGERSLSRFIDTASSVVDRVVACAAARTPAYVHTVADLELMECWLAAYYCTRSDPIYASRQTLRAGGSFVSDPVDPERYRVAAITLDGSGCLSAILLRKKASGAWLGRPPSEQTAYTDRD